jgi:uncharacterized protein
VSASPSFSLPRWLSSPHLQTLGASLPLWAPGSERFANDTARIPLAGDCALHGLVGWQPGAAPHAAVVLVHGVGGTAESRYVVRAALALHRAGYHVLRLNLRGAGEGVHEAPSLYHAGLTADLAAAVEWLGESPRVNAVFVLGFSLGGHVTLRWAGELGAKAPPLLRGVAAVSAPFDLERTTQCIERLRSLPYHRYVVKNLVAQGKQFASLHPRRAHYNAADLRHVGTVREYDTLVVAPMHGWKSAEDYYAAASAGPFVHAIELPSLVVHAEDDPMVPGHLVRDALAQAPPAVEQHWSQRGGHVGWFAGLGEQAWLRTWAMERVLEFFERHALD